MRKRLLAIMICAVMLLSTTIYWDAATKNNKDNKKTEQESLQRGTQLSVSKNGKQESLQRGTQLSVSKNGKLQIERLEQNDKSMGKKGTYTIFVYMCGSDLETNGGFATKDLQEMIDASTSENVRFVIQTGGAKTWKNKIVKSDELGRYEIYGGQIYTLKSQADDSMGDADTLSAFLEWGIDYAPAAKMGLIFWDHGGGSLVGVCSDEKCNRDKLTLTEIASALEEVSEKMTDKFEFIGYDACLMATLENANVLVPYADYMYASQELEPGAGWDYTAIGEYLDKNPEAKGDALGKAVADSYYKHNGYYIMATFSVTDLSKIDNLMVLFNDYSKTLNIASDDNKDFAMIVRGIVDAERFGKNTPEDTDYTNMVDLAGIVTAGSDYADEAQKVLDAIDDAVIYSIDGGYHKEACGLSVYYPLRLGQNDIATFNNIAVSPYYMAFVSKMAHVLVNGDASGFDEDKVIDIWLESWSKEKISSDAEQYLDEYADAQVTGNSKLFQFSIEPSYYDFDSNGEKEFGFLLTEKSYYNLASISTHAWKYLPEENVLLDLGIRDAGWFKNYWDDTVTCNATGGYHTHYLSDGQPFPQYKLQGNVNSNFYYDTSVYITPVLLNGKNAYLLSGRNVGGNQTNSDGSAKVTPGDTDFIWGAFAGTTEDGMIDRSQILELKAGDVIVPIYHAINLKTGKEYEYYGKEFELPVPFTRGIFADLEKEQIGEEYIVYNFILTDVYGNTYDTIYRMYKRITTISYNEKGKPVGKSTKYEHVDMYKSLY